MVGKIDDHIVCRPALPLDTPGMYELTSKIWDGDDYLPKAWEEWLMDTRGLLVVAILYNRVVGIGKLTKLSTDDWWLEGLRVHPQFEGLGIASRIHDYLLSIWEKIGSGKIRFATLSIREPIKHLAQSRSFRIVGEYITFKAPCTKIQPSNWRNPFSIVELDEIERLDAWFSKRSNRQLAFGLFNLGWQFAPPNLEYLRRNLEEQQIYWWHENQGVLIMVEKQDGSNLWARVRQLVCNPEDLVEILLDTRLIGEKLGFEGITWLAPVLPDVCKSLSAAGYESDWDYSLLVFEKNVPS
jgi:GNAT superfamily N-acetyltransferase